MTTLYRESRDKILLEQYQGLNILPIAETFDRDAIDKLLSQEGCQKIRIYFGMDEALLLHAILVGADADNNDILPSGSSTTLDNPEGESDDNDHTGIVDLAQRCPPECGSLSPLNP